MKSPNYDLHTNRMTENIILSLKKKSIDVMRIRKLKIERIKRQDW